MMLSKDKARIKGSASVSQGLQGRETISARPLLSPRSCCNKCGTTRGRRVAVKRGCNRNVREKGTGGGEGRGGRGTKVGKDTPAGYGTTGPNPPRHLNEYSLIHPKDNEQRRKGLSFRGGERDRSIGHALDAGRSRFCAESARNRLFLGT